MKKQSTSSEIEVDGSGSPLERLYNEMKSGLFASGRTVTELEVSDTEPYEVTFPPARASGARSARRYASKVVVADYESESAGGPVDVTVEVRSNGRGRFAVVSTAISGGKAVTRFKTTNLRLPREVRDALDAQTQQLGGELDYADLVVQLSEVDWVTAAILARDARVPVPPLPSVADLYSQRALRRLSKVEVTVEWGYDIHTLELDFECWVRILRGEWHTASQPYYYEGKRFTAVWDFDGDGNLVVNYDDEGCGWSGSLRELTSLTGPQIDGHDLAVLALSASPAI